MREYIEKNNGKKCQVEYVEYPNWAKSPVISCAGIMMPRYGKDSEIIGITIKIEKINIHNIERPIKINIRMVM